MINNEFYNIIQGIEKLPSNGKVFVYESDINKNSDWINSQHHELKFWHNAFLKNNYFPRYREFSMESMHRWQVEASICANKIVLEIGCGPYGFFPGLLEHSGKLDSLLIAIDPLLSYYQEEPPFKLLERDNIIKIQCPGEDIPLLNSSVDIIVCQNVLDHVADPMKVIKEMARVLKPEGMILLSVHTIPSTFNIFFFIFGALIRRIDVKHPHHFDNNKIFKMFVSEGFQIMLKNTIKMASDHPYSIMDLVKTRNFKLFLASKFIKELFLKVQLVNSKSCYN